MSQYILLRGTQEQIASNKKKSDRLLKEIEEIKVFVKVDSSIYHDEVPGLESLMVLQINILVTGSKIN